MQTKEHKRLAENMNVKGVPPWYKWGPYVSERAWGTVREDYSPWGTAWDYFPHDYARSKAYRWGEDGLAGICDRYQVLVFGLALWNGNDKILKERLFGLVPSEANHGEDVKELYFYLDSTPTHSYMKYLYKYPHAEFPYTKLIEENRRRQSTRDSEYELVDTGVFNNDRYFDVFVEYAKADPEDVCIRIQVANRGPEAASVHLLPQLWFRNTWAWGEEMKPEPVISPGHEGKGFISLLADDRPADTMKNLPFEYRLGERYLYGDEGAALLFTNNETNAERTLGAWAENRRPYVKDAFHRQVIDGENCTNPRKRGTKACFHYSAITVPAGETVTVRLRLSDKLLKKPLADVDKIVEARRAEADEFYNTVHPPKATNEERLIQRQALSGLLWSKQFYYFNVKAWIDGDDPKFSPPESRRNIRNTRWSHIDSMRVMTMPDKWEYPWFAAWDLSFQCVPFALVDPEFAKEQLWILLFEQFQHINGQIPAYEWEFSDLNPPVQAWAVWRVYNIEREKSGRADRGFLERCFHKLMINFAWWVNKVDSAGNNIFEGGFLGLDNITLIDRSHEIPGGAVLQQSDATGWMGMFCLNLMRIALELAQENKSYEGLATKFFQHYAYVGAAMQNMGGGYEMWSDNDGFFYDALCYPDGRYQKLRVRSLVGLIPLYATEYLEEAWIEQFPNFHANFHWFLKNRRDIVKECVGSIDGGAKGLVHMLALVNPKQMRRLLERVWDPDEFLSDYGLRSLSKYHERHPLVFEGREIHYEPAESVERIKGGNSNWRGPVWFPTSFMMIEALKKLKLAYGTNFTIENPEGIAATFEEMASGLANRMINIFTKDDSGRRPVNGNIAKFKDDPHWRDLILFFEYFHGDTGSGIGASHQTGWTALVASLIDEWRRDSADTEV
ncbi:MAG: MGH1-like glycoside hydrolase domain-containing protein [Deltaproteobacteria bacterium]